MGARTGAADRPSAPVDWGVLTLLLAACAGEGTPGDTGWVATEPSAGDSGGETVTDPPTDTDAAYTFVGTPPAEALGLPEFSVENQYGLWRSADYLEGSPVALWFFTTGWTDC